MDDLDGTYSRVRTVRYSMFVVECRVDEESPWFAIELRNDYDVAFSLSLQYEHSECQRRMLVTEAVENAIFDLALNH